MLLLLLLLLLPRLPTADLTGESQPNFHDLHHQKFTVNYGSSGHLDWLLGTHS